MLNAGVMYPGGVADLSAADFAAMVSVNLTGAYAVARAALPHLLVSRGAVVSVASIAALRAASGMGGYAATKAGLAMLTQSLAVDHAHQGLRANAVCPGWTITEMADEEMAAFGAERGISAAQAYELVTALVPQRQPASAGEVAAVVCWLLSDAASYVNGAVIPVDGSAARSTWARSRSTRGCSCAPTSRLASRLARRRTSRPGRLPACRRARGDAGLAWPGGPPRAAIIVRPGGRLGA